MRPARVLHFSRAVRQREALGNEHARYVPGHQDMRMRMTLSSLPLANEGRHS